MGMLWIEITPKAVRTPHASRKRATNSPTVMDDGRSVHAVFLSLFLAGPVVPRCGQMTAAVQLN
jgi:hypothetical protein